jgi:hypothetical protein
MQQPVKPRSSDGKKVGGATAMGAGVGAALGVALSNIAVGVTLGVAIGLGVGVVLDQQSKRKDR